MGKFLILACFVGLFLPSASAVTPITESEVVQYLGYPSGSPQVTFNAPVDMVLTLKSAVDGAFHQAALWGLNPRNVDLSAFSCKVAVLHAVVSPAGTVPLQNIFVCKAADDEIQGYDVFLTFRSPMVTAVALMGI